MLKEHLDYVADAARLESFRAAIARTVPPGSTVVDLGCGSGVLGLLCLQAGAARVYAIDETDMIEVARETLARAGFADRSTCIRGRSTQLELPERVDLAICDHVGYFGFDYGVIGLLADARRRFLKPGGRLIPQQIRLELAAVGSEKCTELVDNWGAERVPPEFHWLRECSVNTKHPVELGKDDVLTSPAPLAEIDLRADNPEFVSFSAGLQATRDAVMHGLAGWFDCQLSDGVHMTNSPLADRPIHRPQAFLPIAEAVTLHKGDRIHATVIARPADALLAWNVRLPEAGKRFSHSTWHGLPMTPEQLVHANPDRVAKLGREGRARLAVLGYCDGKRSAREIEEAVLREHPQLFPDRAEISRFVARVLGRDAA
ncbi:MAG: methyltransferase domain-containing protein [Betaproteobacteria bacterium]|nr:methyltransferase domain-containing protein [Betaproteobacteria bacterium]